VIEHAVEVAVVGAGFGGSLTSMILDHIGLSVVLIDQGTHPRFAIGESSTPIADMLLRDLAQEYDLPRLAELSSYGSWRRAYPEVACGLKRGFSYFHQEKYQPFQPTADHVGEMLVAASANDDVGDTHWYRPDVDAFFAGEVAAAGIPFLDSTQLTNIVEENDGRWLLEGERNGETIRIRAAFIIDATGAGGLLRQHLQLPDETSQLETRSRAIYGHFCNVPRFSDRLQAAGGNVSDHPFDCDAAAVHHLLDGAWMWMLRFDNGITSVGLVLDERRFPLDDSVSVEEEWSEWMSRYPELAVLLHDVRMAKVPARLIRTSRLQRLSAQAAGQNWASLPHTVGFIDPLHSTGIAHALSAIERLADIIRAHSQQRRLDVSPAFGAALQEYDVQLRGELKLVDQLVAGCYRTLEDFRLFAAFSMLYFAAATTHERCRVESRAEKRQGFLCADDARFRNIVRDVTDCIPAGDVTSPEVVAQFEATVAKAIEPYNRVGLCDAAVHNMYRHTAAPSGSGSP
jgi:tetracycline 7-halogenase / FADH2 O2-dependent halogenase